jgi:hypothetical protein
VTSKRVAHTVVPIVALPRGLIFMRRSLRRIGSKRQVIGCYTALPTVARRSHVTAEFGPALERAAIRSASTQMSMAHRARMRAHRSYESARSLMPCRCPLQWRMSPWSRSVGGWGRQA